MISKQKDKLHYKTRRLLFDLDNILLDEETSEEEKVLALRKRMKDVIPTTGGIRCIKQILSRGATPTDSRPYAQLHRINKRSGRGFTNWRVNYVDRLVGYIVDTQSGAQQDRNIREARDRAGLPLAEKALHVQEIWKETPIMEQ